MRWKWIVAGAAGLLALVLIVFYAVLMSYDFNRFKPDIIQEVKNVTGRDLSLGGDIELKVSLSPSLVVEQVALSNAKWGSRSQMISAKKVEVRIELIPLLFSEIKLDKLVLIEPDVLIEINKDGRSNLDFSPPAGQGQASRAEVKTAPSPAKEQTSRPSNEQTLGLPPLTFRELRIENGLLTYHNMQSQQKRTLALQSLSGSLPGMDKPVKLEVKGSVDGEAFTLAGTVGALDKLSGGGSPWPVELKLGFRDATLDLKGSIKNPLEARGLDLAVRAKGADLSRIAPESGLTGPFNLECKLSDPKSKVYKMGGLKLSAHGTDLDGWLQADVSGKRPHITADIKAGVLDLAKLPDFGGAAEEGREQTAAAPKTSAGGNASLKGKQAQSKPSREASGKVFPSDPLPLEALQHADADIKLTAQKVVHHQLALEDFNLGLILSNGKLAVQPLTGKLNGGDLKISLTLAPQGKSARAEFEFSLAGCKAGELLAGLGQDKIVEAPLDVLAQLTGGGTSIAGIMAGLNGKLIITLQKGRINNKYLEVAGGDLGPVLGNIIAPTAKGQPHTQLNCMVMGFRVINGQAKSNVILLNTENMVVLGEGRVNLGSEELDLVMHPSPKKSLTQKATGGLAGISLGELAKPFKLTGTLARPRVGIDEAGVITTLAKTVGGYALLGPLGAAAGALTSPGAGEEAGCAEALAAAHSGGKFEPKATRSEDGKPAEGQQETTGQNFEKSVEEGVNKLKSLFGN